MTGPIDIPPGHLKIGRDIIRERLPSDVDVWVFGSRASHTTKNSSDLDLAIKGPERISHKVMTELAYAFEESDLPYTVDVVDLTTAHSRFRQIVDGNKIPLFSTKNGHHSRDRAQPVP